MSAIRKDFFLPILFLLALLQCLAPLLHAHAYGMSVTAGVHLYDVDEVGQAPDGVAGGPTLVADREEAPAIGMAQEFRQDGGELLQHVYPTPATDAAHVASSRPVLPTGPPLEAASGLSPPYSLPFAHAPPAVLS